MMWRNLIMVLLSAVAPYVSATELADSTLRLDLVLCGQPDGSATVGFVRSAMWKGWGGRTVNLQSLVREGYSDVTMTDASNPADTLFRQSYSILFDEWLTTPDRPGAQAMEHTLLMPMPRGEAMVTFTLRNSFHRVIASASKRVSINDLEMTNYCERAPLPSEQIFCGDSACIRVAFIAEGFTEAEMPQYIEYARRGVQSILATTPYNEFAQYFEFVAIKTPSVQSGVSVPADGIWRQTAFNSSYSTLGFDRYLTINHIHGLYDALIATPYTHIIVLANSNEYGGGGFYNTYTITAAPIEKYASVLVHEFGHSFAGLGDEYYYDTEVCDQMYPDGIEPWEPNITALIGGKCKWQPLIDSGEAQLVEGAGYRAKGLWRSASDCRMRSHQSDFCPVCVDAIRKLILSLIAEQK